MHLFSAQGVCDGMVVGKAFVIKKEARNEEMIKARSGLSCHDEIKRYKAALECFERDTYALIKGAVPAHQEILERHVMIANDHLVLADVEQLITRKSMTSEATVATVFNKQAQLFLCMEDETMKARAADFVDIKTRLIEILSGVHGSVFEQVKGKCIIVANELSPSEMMRIERTKVMGIITEAGGSNSHMAIMARAMGVPTAVGATVIGAKGLLDTLESGELIALCVEGAHAEIIVRPDESDVKRLSQRPSSQRPSSQRPSSQRPSSQKLSACLERENTQNATVEHEGRPKTTPDDVRVHINANISGTWGLDELRTSGADGIGLFRSEYIFFGRDCLPDETLQFKIYKKAAQIMGDKPTTIRTLDIGADKTLPYFHTDASLRGIRLCLAYEEMFSVQLRAILRAGAFGNVRIMLPMVSEVSEVRRVKLLIEAAKDELKRRNEPFKDIALGVMIETPAAVITADILARECDFFSIGTNDLTSYILAQDRLGKEHKHMHSVYEPAVMRAIHKTIQAGKKAGLQVFLCGEAAADINLSAFLIACGLDEFSVSPRFIPDLRRAIYEKPDTRPNDALLQVLNMTTGEEIRNYLMNFRRNA